MIKNFRQLRDEAKKKEFIVTGIPWPHDENSIKTAISAKSEGISDFILAGNKSIISNLIVKCGSSPESFTIVEAETEEAAASKIVSLSNEGKVNVILKGFLPTAKLMKPVLDKNRGLRTGNLLSDILVIENPLKEEEKLVGLSDGGLVILPDLNQKIQIIQNSVRVFHKLGYDCPNIGIMAAIESVKESMPATIHAEKLTELNRKGEIHGCRVYGPLAFDIAVSKEAAEHKKITDPVAGNVDIMIMPNIESGNLLGKSFTYYLKSTVSHVVMGARIPILIPSRNESETDKIHSIALGVIVA